ncbi:uncharacterized protein [Nicotiana sylvestris]|uniref:uncharacterized protein n=1 Tax=Nicotiana sylvestris TaxID=4096 RepID=UPI00388CDA7E
MGNSYYKRVRVLQWVIKIGKRIVRYSHGAYVVKQMAERFVEQSAAATELMERVDVQALTNQFVRLDVLEPSRVLACVVPRSSLFDRIRERPYDDPHLLVLKDKVQHGDVRYMTIGDNRVLRMQGRICLSNIDGLRELILDEAHSSRYSIHPGATKMYQDLRQHYWWRRTKKDIVGFESRCLNYQQVKY